MIRPTLVIAIFFLAVSSVYAIGLSVSPPELNASGTIFKAASAKFTVKNSSNEVALFEIYPDDFTGEIKISPESFVLNPGDKKEILAEAGFKKSGKYRTDISVVAKPMTGSSLKAAGGLKIPFTADIGEERSTQLGLLMSSINMETLIILSAIFALGILVFGLKYGFQKFKKAKN
ncbi:hypothetical protein A3H65_02850 [Candidatus Giovannonibacteria bacterium RIFCSPLOWO2_02_FULL_45_14]|uniref:Uncharacterized protein n=3 Tax=Parcubacteria group TaxID=1794811 RepID=A0A0H4TC98_9BACT|nr:hypothetical protein [uncultured Parcubacteria bacterium Rifle_16ft_4_minimus_37658]AKQ05648.1 hypothetical protein [uncultured Parcubacteria bacterium Rifle_16ft_4_minimus_23641]OGF69954.1 MAG: hypothetical protein A3C75_01265 [Candidatus Giovannonibacteria bacterium RIFCSPHIGHO2_02_FULL_44_31]OGF76993.1 MAG: hypothetical protein A3E62_01505 [Candidatus Giovannonibacteria bacterium RIFCSPHIGHO2_12_FULL_44_29]OGF90494.1 MAG: hypothetical protein A3H65_02850 [Candidatus Giovannonibacteria bac